MVRNFVRVAVGTVVLAMMLLEGASQTQPSGCADPALLGLSVLGLTDQQMSSLSPETAGGPGGLRLSWLAVGGVGPGRGSPGTKRSLEGESVPLPLSEAIAIQVSVQPGFGAAHDLKLICITNVYRGESSAQTQHTGFQMGISGTIERIAQDKFLVSYDLGVKLKDSTGMMSFSAAGSGVLADGKPTTLVAIGGRSVVMTVSLVAPGESAK